MLTVRKITQRAREISNKWITPAWISQPTDSDALHDRQSKYISRHFEMIHSSNTSWYRWNDSTERHISRLLSERNVDNWMSRTAPLELNKQNCLALTWIGCPKISLEISPSQNEFTQTEAVNEFNPMVEKLHPCIHWYRQNTHAHGYNSF